MVHLGQGSGTFFDQRTNFLFLVNAFPKEPYISFRSMTLCLVQRSTAVWLCCLVSLNEASQALAQLHAFSTDTLTQPLLHSNWSSALTNFTHVLTCLGVLGFSRKAEVFGFRRFGLFRIYSLCSFNPWTKFTPNKGVTLQDTALWPSSHALQFLLRDDLRILISFSTGSMLSFFSCPLLHYLLGKNMSGFFTVCAFN